MCYGCKKPLSGEVAAVYNHFWHKGIEIYGKIPMSRMFQVLWVFQAIFKGLYSLGEPSILRTMSFGEVGRSMPAVRKTNGFVQFSLVCSDFELDKQ